jgi:hypothetical protein
MAILAHSPELTFVMAEFSGVSDLALVGCLVPAWLGDGVIIEDFQLGCAAGW